MAWGKRRLALQRVQTVFARALFSGFLAAGHWTVMGATAFKYAASQKALFVRRRQGPIGVFAGDWQMSAVAGLDYNVRIGRVLMGLGAAYLTNTTFINGTRWNFELRLGYLLAPRLEVMVTHFSNCKQLCGFSRSGPNLGWEFLGVAYRLP